MNKSQVKSLLEVISKDETRPVLTYALIDDFEGRLTLVATDGYILTAIALETVDEEWRTIHKGKLISRETLTKWYKLASIKDILNTEELLGMAETLENMNFPNWQKIVTDAKPESTPVIAFNAQYALTLEKLAGASLSYTLHGKSGAMQAKMNDSIYLLMPLKEGR